MTNDGVSLFPLNDSNYFLIDTFAVQGKILQYERLTKKNKGISIPSTSKNSINTFGYAFPKDTIVNGNKLYYVDTTLNGLDTIGNVTLSFFFIKSGKFNSCFNVKNTAFPKYKFAYVGFSQKAVKSNEQAMVLLEDITPVTKQQNKICKSLSKKAERYNSHRPGP
jgi:hypothetical protein